MNFRDIELLSAYLDGRLSASETARLEARLASEGELKAALDDLRGARDLLRRLPPRRAPRNFTIRPGMAGLKAPEPRAYPALRLATALATFLFVISVAVNGLTPLATRHLAAAPAPAYGMGGGAGGGPSESTSAPAATEAPAQPFAAVMPTPTAEMSAEATAPAAAQDNGARGSAAATELPGISKAAPPIPPVRAAPAAVSPVPSGWIIALALLAIGFALATWLLRRNAERAFQRRWNKK